MERSIAQSCLEAPANSSQKSSNFRISCSLQRETAKREWAKLGNADLPIAIGLMNAYNRLAIGFRNPPAVARNVDVTRCGE